MDAPEPRLEEPVKKPAAKRKPRAKPSATSDTGKPEPVKCTIEHIYIVTSPEMRAASKFKVGFHTGDRDKLLHRYVTALNEVELVLFIRGSLAEEQFIHDRLSPYRVPNHNNKASEWYIMSERVLLGKVMEILNSITIEVPIGLESATGLAVVTPSVIHFEDSRYVGPLKFLHACEDARWDLVREWLSSRDYKQDKHVRSKLQRRGDKDSQTEALRWNEAHQWIACLELMCAATGVPITVVELLLNYCDRRWTRSGNWVEPSEARSIGFLAAKKGSNGPLLEHLQTWGADAVLEPPPNVRPRPVSGPRLVPRTNPSDILRVFDLIEGGNPMIELTSDTRSDGVLIQSIALHVGETATRIVAREVCTVLHRGDPSAKSALQKIMERGLLIVVSSAVHAAELQCAGLLYKFINLGISVRQICTTATSMCNIPAVEFLVVNMGATWSFVAGDAALLWIQQSNRSMVDHVATKEMVNWDHALINGAIHGRLDVVRCFVSMGAKRVDVALDRALKAGAPVEVVEYLCSITSDKSNTSTTNSTSVKTETL